LIRKWNLSIYLNPQYFAATLALLWSADSLEPHNMGWAMFRPSDSPRSREMDVKSVIFSRRRHGFAVVIHLIRQQLWVGSAQSVNLRVEGYLFDSKVESVHLFESAILRCHVGAVVGDLSKSPENADRDSARFFFISRRSTVPLVILRNNRAAATLTELIHT
jgi:hypothetical protein